jgi:uncharacterized membrane protein HdeD (DUF308 family)
VGTGVVAHRRHPPWWVLSTKETPLLIFGLILLLLGFLLKISILWTIGIILLVVGAVLFLLGSTGRAVGGRRHWY